MWKSKFFEVKSVFQYVFYTFAVPKAGVVKLVDTPDLGSGAARLGGSSPSTRTKTETVRGNSASAVSVFSCSPALFLFLLQLTFIFVACSLLRIWTFIRRHSRKTRKYTGC